MVRQSGEGVDFDFGSSEQQPRIPLQLVGLSPVVVDDWGRTTDLAFASC